MTTLLASGQILLRWVKVIEIVFLNFLTLSLYVLLSFHVHQEKSTYCLQYLGVWKIEDGER